MGSISTKVVINRLLVADVDEDVIEYAKFGSFAARHQQTALQHILYQPHSLEAYRLAAGIRARDDKDVGIVVKLEIERHHLFDRGRRIATFVLGRGWLAIIKEQQGMAGIEPIDFGDAVHNRASAMQQQGKTGLGADKIDACKEPIGIDQRVELGANHIGETGKDFLNFMTFCKLQFAEVIVQLHHLGGLEIGGLASGRLVMNEAFYFTAVGVEHGDDHAAVADSDFGIFGSPALMFGSSQLFADLNIHIVALTVYLTADVEKEFGSVVVDFSFVIHYFADGLSDGGVKVHMGSQLVEQGVANGVVAQQKTKTFTDSVERAFQVEQCLQFDHSAGYTKAVELVGEVDKILGGETVFEHQNLAEFLSLLQFAHHAVVVAGKRHLFGHVYCKSIGTFVGQQLANLGKSEFFFYSHKGII